MAPVKVEIKDNNLIIVWTDNKKSSIKLANLRKMCPCAVCIKENEDAGEEYIPIYTQQQLSIVEIIPSGNYALNILWQDGHNLGFYDFNYLRKISDIIEE